MITHIVFLGFEVRICIAHA